MLSTSTLHVMKPLLLSLVLLLLVVPSFSFAATARPSCSLMVRTSDGDVAARGTEKHELFLHEGDIVQITWKSKNAETARDGQGESVSLSGVATFTVRTSSDYSYHFSAGSREVSCGVSVQVIAGAITSASTFIAAKPTISGTASGVKTVQVLIRREGATQVLYKSKMLKVHKETWKTKVSKKLPNGNYDVEVVAGKGATRATLVSGTFSVNTDKKNSTSSAASLQVSAVPLLAGGVATAGSEVPISYLQIRNSGKESVLLQGFWVKENGSAAPRAVIGFSAIDDQGVSRGRTGGSEGSTPFKNGLVFVPAVATFAPGEMRLYTIKGVLTSNTSAYRGQQLMIDVTALDATASVKGVFPIRGTTWTIQ